MARSAISSQPENDIVFVTSMVTLDRLQSWLLDQNYMIHFINRQND